ncbi:MAG: FtsX-like permease family protein [Acidobacteria bacterium]|nr:MAG: FtsX-like permease family protein [Acidobacteriota bacterium]
MIRSVAHGIHPDVSVVNSRSMSEIAFDSMKQRRLVYIVIVSLAVVGLVLAGVGVYGVVSLSMSQRSREFGVRVALGARSVDLCKLVLTETWRVCGLGIGCGVVGAAALDRLAGHFVLQSLEMNVGSYILAAVCMLTAASVAAWIPAVRVLGFSPVESLRGE